MGATQTIPNWLRSYELTVYSPKETKTLTSSLWEPRALRITFEILQSVLPSPYWYADIDVYNLNQPDMQNLVQNATRVTLKAGYQSTPGNQETQNNYGIIWDGPVLQMMFDRQNVVDQKFTFHCIASIPLLNNAFVQARNGIMSTQYDVLQKMIGEVNSQNKSGVPFNVNLGPAAQAAIQAKQYPRGRGFFGQLPDFLSQLADDNFLVHYQDGVNANLTELAAPGSKLPAAAITYAPPNPPGYVAGQNGGGNVSRTIIGVPRQTQFGVIMNVLLDPRLVVKNPPILVHLERTVISQAKVQVPTVQTPLDTPLNFFATQIRHRGDSRGQAWYTEVNGIQPTYAQGYLKGIFSPVSGGAQ
jgi:hypothetical protein